MKWIEDTQKAINFIENNLFEDILVDDVAGHVHYSANHLQKMFIVATGLSISDYIKNRRLTIAGQELINSNANVLDLAFKYGYETSEGFSRAFKRFHGCTPSKAGISESQLKCFNPLTIKIDAKGGFIMSKKLVSNVENIKETIIYKEVEFDIIERPDVVWVGCVAYADNNIDPAFADDDMTLIRRYQALVDIAPKQELINPAWSASISINYSCNDKPSGIMFAQETYSDKQDKQYDLLVQPSGLWLRLRNDKNAAALLGKDSADPYEYFDLMRIVASENGYMSNQNVHIEVEYHCHAEYNTPVHTNYAYIPICAI